MASRIDVMEALRSEERDWLFRVPASRRPESRAATSRTLLIDAPLQGVRVFALT
jgi:hypothetical protein